MKPVVASALGKARCFYPCDLGLHEQVQHGAEQHHRLLARLHKAAAAGDVRAIRAAQHRILTSRASRLTCMTRALKAYDKPSAEQMKLAAADLNPFIDCGEPVFVKAEPKSSGKGWRPVCSFGLRRRALQRLCLDILEAKFGADETDYLCRGRGADIASDRIVELVGQGLHDFVLADVENFFRSVQQGELSRLTGLPMNVVESCMLIGQSVPLMTVGLLLDNCNHETLHGAAREGLPQGSRASQYVASLLLGPVLKSVTSVDRGLIHGDDILIAAGHVNEAHALMTTLAGALKSHPAGPFRLKRCEVANIYSGFNFLKYRFRLDPLTGVVKRRPSWASYQRFARNVTMIALYHEEKKLLRELACYRRRWMNAFTRWPHNRLSRLHLSLSIIEAVQDADRLKQKLSPDP